MSDKWYNEEARWYKSQILISRRKVWDRYMKKDEKNKKQKTKSGVRAISSMRFKVNLLLVVSLSFAALLVSLSMIMYTKGIVIDSAYAKMNNIVDSYGAAISREEAENNNKPLSTEEYKEILQGLRVDGSPSSYCYILNKSGIVTYHDQDEKKINGPNKVEVVNKVVGDLNKGIMSDTNCLEYEENGVTMYASYTLTDARSVLVMCANGNELMSAIRKMAVYSTIAIVVVLIICLAIGNILLGRFLSPLKKVTMVIDETARLNLVLPADMGKLCKRRDETGMIARAVRDMSVSLHEVVGKIEGANNSIRENMEQLESSSNKVHLFCTDNSATTQQLAASTEEVTGMTNLMAEHVDVMKTQFEEINNQTLLSNKKSEEIAIRARNMQESTKMAITKTTAMYEQIKDKTDMALNGLKAVDKINELTEAIIEISDQTSLLSLNASIEAARAGEAGRGFAVVASEISNLAHRSLETVSDINAIIAEVNYAVKNISDSMGETSGFLEKTVLADYDNFKEISDQYLRDADDFRESMTHISKDASLLNESIQEVSVAVDRIRTTIDETAIGVGDIAEKTSNVVLATSDNYDLTNNTVASIDDLKGIVNKFHF